MSKLDLQMWLECRKAELEALQAGSGERDDFIRGQIRMIELVLQHIKK